MTRSRRKTKPRADGKYRAATLALMALSEAEGELAHNIQWWETGYKVGKQVVPARCGPRPILGTLVSCGCRLRKWNGTAFYWEPVQWRVAPSQLQKRCFVCHQWRKPVA